jgi:DNA-binding NtrC family response regulator
MSMEKMDYFPGTKWILVKDTDGITRSNMRSMLEQVGYKVCLADNDDEVIDCYKEAQRCGYPFDAVIVDLHVPKSQSDQEIIKRLIECDPGVKVIATSGTGADVFTADLEYLGFKGVLKRPLTCGSLEQTVHSVINTESRYQ